MSLTIGGQINRGILWYDDGSMTGFRAADSIESTSRMRMIGSAKIATGWTAGYYLELEYVSTGSFGTDQVDSRRAIAQDAVMGTQNNGHGNSPFSVGIRQAHWYLKNDRLGTVSVGRLNSATKDFAGIELGNIAVIAESDLRINNGDFFLRRAGTTGREGLCANGLGCGQTLRWQNFSGGFGDNFRFDGVRYDSPTIMGFTLSTAIGDDVRWDVALRYTGEWNGFKSALGVGFVVDMDEGVYNGEIGTLAGAAGQQLINTANGIYGLKTGRREQRDFKYNWSTIHLATGLFMSGAYWHKEFNGTGVDTTSAAFCQNGGINCQRPDVNEWWLAGGIRRNFFGLGDTSIYGQWGKVEDGITGLALNTAGVASTGGVNFGAVTNSETRTIGAGIVQNIDAAAMTMYLGWQHRTVDVSGCATAATAAAGTVGCTAANSAAAATTVKQGFEALDTVYGGAVIRF